MSGNNFGHYYQPNNGNYNNKHWKNWMMDQVLNTTYDGTTPNVAHNLSIPPPPPPMRNNYYNNYQNNQNNGRLYRPPRRYNSNNQYGTSPNWNNKGTGFKRQRMNSEEAPTVKPPKKKNKPLSQNIPKKKEWTLEEAEAALACEKEYNKHHKNLSLIVKFPDLELSKEIVSKFHNAIENVHFQQPSTARFCFVTLQEGADGDNVISALNKVKFGAGYLTAEYKKERSDDQNIGPEDIMPLTLFVGNLAQEITKEDMVKTYPKSRRIDIGYAKKMKYTRYAFVTFHNVNDAIEAFKNTRNTQLYSKSLIVRFRRMHGNVGMPGEAKPQNSPKPTNKEADACSTSTSTELAISTSTNTTADDSKVVEIKKEPTSESEEEEDEEEYNEEEMFARHKPIIKTEIKEEKPEPFPYISGLEPSNSCSNVVIKEEPVPETRYEDESLFQNFYDCKESEDNKDNVAEPGFGGSVNFGIYYEKILKTARNIKTTK